MITLLIFLTINVSSVITMQGGFRIGVDDLNCLISIRYDNVHICSGAIINDNHILTAGSCVNGLHYSTLSVAVGISTLYYQSNTQSLNVWYIHIHPDFKNVNSENLYSFGSWENNIAVLELEGTLVWEQTIAPVRLIDVEHNWDPCVPCKLLGCSVTTMDAATSVFATWTFGRILQDKECHSAWIHISENEKCVADLINVTIMEKEDRGAPLICEGETVGIIVGGGIGTPTVVLSIYPYLKFIAAIINAGAINVPLEEFQYYVSIWHLGIYRCAGSIISANHILTAGHCVENVRRTDLRIVAGHREFSENDRTIQWLFVYRIHIHPDYETEFNAIGTIMRNDIAILTLAVSLMWSDNIKPIPLAQTLPGGQNCRIYRWSRTITRGNVSLKSMWSSAMILDAVSCQRLQLPLQINQFAVSSFYALPIMSIFRLRSGKPQRKVDGIKRNIGYLPTKYWIFLVIKSLLLCSIISSSSTGDSGSPIVCDGRVAGIVFGAQLVRVSVFGALYPITSFSIFPYHDFITEIAPDATF